MPYQTPPRLGFVWLNRQLPHGVPPPPSAPPTFASYQASHAFPLPVAKHAPTKLWMFAEEHSRLPCCGVAGVTYPAYGNEPLLGHVPPSSSVTPLDEPVPEELLDELTPDEEPVPDDEEETPEEEEEEEPMPEELTPEELTPDEVPFGASLPPSVAVAGARVPPHPAKNAALHMATAEPTKRKRTMLGTLVGAGLQGNEFSRGRRSAQWRSKGSTWT
jgi:hypothetical protein